MAKNPNLRHLGSKQIDFLKDIDTAHRQQGQVQPQPAWHIDGWVRVRRLAIGRGMLERKLIEHKDQAGPRGGKVPIQLTRLTKLGYEAIGEK